MDERSPKHYRDWLGIENHRFPISHYVLLGLTPFENSESAIREAFHRQYERVRKYEVGTFEDTAQRILAELSQAFQCLTHPESKLQYDQKLKSESIARGAVSIPAPIAPPLVEPPQQMIVMGELVPLAPSPTSRGLFAVGVVSVIVSLLCIGVMGSAILDRPSKPQNGGPLTMNRVAKSTPSELAKGSQPNASSEDPLVAPSTPTTAEASPLASPFVFPAAKIQRTETKTESANELASLDMSKVPAANPSSDPPLEAMEANIPVKAKPQEISRAEINFDKTVAIPHPADAFDEVVISQFKNSYPSIHLDWKSAIGTATSHNVQLVPEYLDQTAQRSAIRIGVGNNKEATLGWLTLADNQLMFKWQPDVAKEHIPLLLFGVLKIEGPDFEHRVIVQNPVKLPTMLVNLEEVNQSIALPEYFVDFKNSFQIEILNLRGFEHGTHSVPADRPAKVGELVKIIPRGWKELEFQLTTPRRFRNPVVLLKKHFYIEDNHCIFSNRGIENETKIYKSRLATEKALLEKNSHRLTSIPSLIDNLSEAPLPAKSADANAQSNMRANKIQFLRDEFARLSRSVDRLRATLLKTEVAIVELESLRHFALTMHKQAAIDFRLISNIGDAEVVLAIAGP